MADLVKTIVSHEEVRRIMIVPNAEEGNTYSTLRNLLRNVDDEEKHVTMFAMMPMEEATLSNKYWVIR